MYFQKRIVLKRIWNCLFESLECVFHLDLRLKHFAFTNQRKKNNLRRQEIAETILNTVEVELYGKCFNTS